MGDSAQDQRNKTPNRLALSIDAWKFLDDVSPSSIGQTAAEFPADEELENLKLKRALAGEQHRRSEIVARLDNVESRAAHFVDAVQVLEEISDQLAQTRETLRKVGELAMEFPGVVRSEIVSLCAAVGIAVGPCIQISGWRGLPRLRVFEDDLQICFQLCSEDGTVRASAVHRGKNFDQSEISLPIALLPGDAIACMFKILETGGDSNQLVAYSQRIDVDALFADGLSVSVPLFRHSVPLPNAFLSIRAQGISDHDIVMKIGNLEISSSINPDSLTLSVFLGESLLRQFPLNRMNSKDVGRIKQGAPLHFHLHTTGSSSSAGLVASASILALSENSECILKDTQGNLIGRILLDTHN